MNSERSITGEKPVDGQQRSVRPDFLLVKDGVEIAVGECGKEDLGGIGKKELMERNLHVPKIMKDLLVRALSKGRHQVSLAQKLKIVAINQNGKYVFSGVLFRRIVLSLKHLVNIFFSLNKAIVFKYVFLIIQKVIFVGFLKAVNMKYQPTRTSFVLSYFQ